MHRMTNKDKIYTMRVDMKLFSGQHRYAQYTNFSIQSELYSYKLEISGYSGNAGMYSNLTYANKYW